MLDDGYDRQNPAGGATQALALRGNVVSRAASVYAERRLAPLPAARLGTIVHGAM